ncbi:uncharacterized protein LOC136037310 isoform X2 [Artemia franciscana]|uniref:uncharacterized protein LOC136037310 isoform X2 n=1 Tax=Artemia franciscana TaxID=6661 RepID=UPI0032DBA6F1
MNHQFFQIPRIFSSFSGDQIQVNWSKRRMYSYESDCRPPLRTVGSKGNLREPQDADKSPSMSAKCVYPELKDEDETAPQASNSVNIDQNLSFKECLNIDEADKSHHSAENLDEPVYSRQSSKITVKKTNTFKNTEFDEGNKLVYGFKYTIRSIASKFESLQVKSGPSDVSISRTKSSENDKAGKDSNIPTYGFKINIEEPKPYKNKINWIVLVLILLLSVMMHSFMKSEDTPVVEKFSYERAVKTFKAELKDIHKNHRNQEYGNWAKISTGLDAISNVSLAPHVLILTGESKNKTEDFAFKLHSAFSKAFENEPCTPLNGIEYSNISEGNMFFDDVNECMEKHSVLIYDIDLVHGLNAMHLHAFADNENAPFKTSAIYLTIVSECKDDVEKCVRNLISEKWKGHETEDRILSLYSRILNMAVTVV